MRIEGVHRDSRGKIHVVTGLLEDELELTIHQTWKGCARGGYIHPQSEEYLVVVEGKLMNIVDGEDIQVLHAGDITIIPCGVSHMYVALEDSVAMEWGVPLTEKQDGYGEWRKIVDEVNKE